MVLSICFFPFSNAYSLLRMFNTNFTHILGLNSAIYESSYMDLCFNIEQMTFHFFVLRFIYTTQLGILKDSSFNMYMLHFLVILHATFFIYLILLHRTFGEKETQRTFENKSLSFDSFCISLQHDASWWCTIQTKFFCNSRLPMIINNWKNFL